MLNDAIRVGDKLNILQLDVKSANEYFSKLLDMKEDGTISIAMPIEKKQVIILDIGSKYRVTFYTEKGLFASEAVVVKRYKVKSIYVAELKILEKPQKIQRREYYRFQCIIDMQYCEVPVEEFTQAYKKIDSSNTAYGYTQLQKKIRAVELLKDMDAANGTHLIEMKRAVITDISGGGLRIKTTTELTQKQDIYLIFSINNGLRNIHVFGEVITSEKSKIRSNLYEHRLKFTDISDEERENIVRYVLNEERKLRQKEKGFC